MPATRPQYRDLIIANRNGATVRLGDVAQVFDMRGRRHREHAHLRPLQRQGRRHGAGVPAAWRQHRRSGRCGEGGAAAAEEPIDPKIDLAVTHDRSITIRASLHQVEQTLVLAIAMVILVVYIFLNSVRAALIPAVVVPVSLIGTFGVMYLLGYSLDNFSLMALTIATGFVVDDAIVVMENTTRHIEAGMPRMRGRPARCARSGLHRGVDEPVAGGGVHPIQLIGGILGRLFREFTVTLSVAILISLVISLTTTPMMCARLLGRERRTGPRARARPSSAALPPRGAAMSARWAGRSIIGPLMMLSCC